MTGRPMTAVELQAVGDGEPILVQFARSKYVWPMVLRFVKGAPTAYSRPGNGQDAPAKEIFVGWLRPGLTSIDDRVWRDGAAPSAAPELFHAEQKREG